MKHGIKKQLSSILSWHRSPRHALRTKQSRRWVVGSVSALLATMSATGVAINFPPVGASAAPLTLPATTPLAFEDANGAMACDQGAGCTGTTPNYLDWSSPYVTSSPAFLNIPDKDTGCAPQDIIFASGTKENDTNVTVACSPSTPKVNLSQAYGWTQTVGGHDYLYLAWEALVQNGSNNNHIDFELNQASPVFSPALNGAGSYTLNRTVGDLLFDFDITPGTPVIAESTWTGSAWSTPATLSGAQAAVAATGFTDPINGATVPAGGFGEMGLDLTNSGLFQPGTCAHLTNLWVKGRSSGSGSTSELKSFIPPTGTQISNCATPGLVTTASATDLPSGTISDSGVLSGGTTSPAIGGTLTFNAYGPFTSAATANCTSKLAFSVADTVSGNGTYTTGSPHAVTNAGTYVWQAVYSGDSGNAAFTTTCGDTSGNNHEVSVVNPASPGIATTASATNLPSGSISDSGVLSGGSSPGGSLTFNAYGPFTGSQTPNCTSPLAFTVTDTVNGNGTYTTGSPHAVTDAGTYVWQTVYTGDGNNNGFTSPCGLVNETNHEVSTVGPAMPSITTTASATDLPSGTIADSGNLTGGSSNITGSLTFNAYGPFTGSQTPNCTSPLAFTVTDTVNGNGTYTTGSPHAVSDAGTYVWQVVYSDGTNNSGFTTACGLVDANNHEVSVVGPASPTIVTSASATNLPSGSISDSGTLSGGSSNITGSLTFNAYGPFDNTADANCTSPLAFTVTDTVNGNGSYTSGAPHAVSAAGVYVWQVVYSDGTNNNGFTSPCGDQVLPNNEVSLVGKAGPTIATQASATDLPSGSISDSGSLTGGTSPTGSLTFNAYGPFTGSQTPNCTSPLAFTVTDTVNGNGTYTTGSPHAVSDAGTYVWQTVYTGDNNNAGFTSTCGLVNDTNHEVSTVGKASPGIVTTASATDLPNGTIGDSGTLSGGSSNITGSLTFNAYGPFTGSQTPNCSSPLAFSVTDNVTGNGPYNTGAPQAVTDAGTYVWQVVYNGDGNNNGFTSTCGLVDETNHEVSVVGKASPGIVTTASATDLPAGTIGDSGNLTGGSSNMGGTLTFNAYGPFTGSQTPNCTSPLAFSVDDTVSGNNTYTTGAPHTVTDAGTYVWQVVYSGDANNNGFTSGCGTVDESNHEVSTVGKASPGIVTTATATGLPAGTIGDSGNLTGGSSEQGSLTFSAYGPFTGSQTPVCTGTAVFSVTVPVDGDGTYPAGPDSVSAAGTYVWQVVYTGDSNNNGFTTTCGDTSGDNHEVSTVDKASPGIVTTATATALPNGTITDNGVFSGGSDPGGTLTF
ncbi:MAG TPA: hypothetical protein VKR22_15630, partial [Acidimicrobiales bacterium]|nr:hypothetical protein [Acidimicrobiales bacterium]